MARPALADRMAPPPWAKSSIDTVFLGTWRDFEGHPASYFFDVDGRRVLGPIEHALKPNIKLAFRPGPPPAASAGSPGALTVWREGAEGAPGIFGAFKPAPRSKAKPAPSLVDIVATINDPLLLGLLAGSSPVQTEAQQRLASRPKDQSSNDKASRALGILYAAPAQRGKELLKDSVDSDLLHIELRILLSFVYDPLPELAKLAVDKDGRWVNHVPALAARWLASKPQTFEAKALDYLFGNNAGGEGALDAQRMTPDEQPAWPGAFQLAHELGHRTLVTLLRKKDRRFGGALVALFRGLHAFKDGFVVDVAAGGQAALVLRKEGYYAWLRLPAGTQVLLGAQLQTVGREREGARGGAEGRFGRHDDVLVVAVTRVAVLATDPSAALARLQDYLGANSTAPSQTLLVLEGWARAGVVAQWKPDQFWALVTKLLGNRPRTFRDATSAWAPLFESALQHAQGPELARGFLQHLPDLMKAFVGSTREADGNAFRSFMMQAATPAVLSCLLGGDLDCADRLAAALAGPPGGLLPPGTKLAPETEQTYSLSRIRPVQVLVAQLMHKPTPIGPPASRGFEAQLFERSAKAFPAEAAARWQAALVAAGYPAKP